MGKLSCVNMFAITPTYLMALLRTTVQRRLRREIVHIDTQDWCSTVTRLISELQRKWFARERRA